jgi:hypothetical protein
MKSSFLFLKLKILITNEKNSLEILPFNFNIILFFKELIQYHKHFYYEKKMYSTNKQFLILIKKVEIYRIKFLLKMYARVRLWKIDRYFGLEKKKKLFFKYLNFIEKKYARAFNYFFFKTFGKFLENFLPLKIPNELNLRKIFFEKKKSDLSDYYVFFKIFIKKKNFKQNYRKKNIFVNFYSSHINCMKFKFIKKLLFSENIFLL